MTRHARPAPMVLLHGFWHGSWCWSALIAQLAAASQCAVAIDMAGHGLHARIPRCLSARPFDVDLLTTERSPVADVTLDDAADLLAKDIEAVGGGQPVTVVAHSMGGTVLTRVAQQSPDLIAHAVYLSAFMPASDIPAGAYFGTPEGQGGLLSELGVGDYETLGALRIDTASNDTRHRLREALYADVDPVTADAAVALLTPDAPIGIALGSTSLTADGWGSVPRTYVTSSRDLALPLPLQRLFIAEADAAFSENPTTVVDLEASHSPFLSMPREVAAVLTGAHLSDS